MVKKVDRLETRSSSIEGSQRDDIDYILVCIAMGMEWAIGKLDGKMNLEQQAFGALR